MGVVSKLRGVLLYSTTIPDEDGDIRRQVTEDNRRFATALSVFGIVAFALLVLSTAGGGWLTYFRAVYLASIAVCTVTLVVASVLAPRTPALTDVVVCVMKVAYLAVGIGIACSLPDGRTATFVATALLVPIMFVTDTLPTLVMELAAVALYVIVGSRVCDADVYSWTLTQLVVFSLDGVLIGHLINRTRLERYVFSVSAARLARANARRAELQERYAYFDQMTGVRNRRAYSEAFDGLARPGVGRYSIAVVDVNGLKEVNDRLGHAAGDELIVAVADAIQACFEGDDVFRLGGDEFAVISARGADEVEASLAELASRGDAWVGEHARGFSLAYGVASSNDHPDAGAVERAADRSMYESKRRHYEALGGGRSR